MTFSGGDQRLPGSHPGMEQRLRGELTRAEFLLEKTERTLSGFSDLMVALESSIEQPEETEEVQRWVKEQERGMREILRDSLWTKRELERVVSEIEAQLQQLGQALL